MLKTERLTMKVLPAHKAALEQIAQTEDTSEAAIVRRLIRREAERRGLWPSGQGHSVPLGVGGTAMTTKTISGMAKRVGTGKAVSDDDPVTVVWVCGRGNVPVTVIVGGSENSPTWRRVLPVVAARVVILVTLAVVILVLFGNPQQGQNLGHFLGGIASGLTGAP